MDSHSFVDSFSSLTQYGVWYTVSFVWVEFVLPVVRENKLLVIFLDQNVRSFLRLKNIIKWYLNHPFLIIFRDKE